MQLVASAVIIGVAVALGRDDKRDETVLHVVSSVASLTASIQLAQ